MAAQMLMLYESLEFSIDKESVINSEDDGEINILSAVATFMRRNLVRNQGYYECSLPAYSIDEFKSHFNMTRVTMEALCREVQATGRIPRQQAFGWTPIPLRKQVLAFLWFMANSEVIRSVSDMFDITLDHSPLVRIPSRFETPMHQVAQQ